MTPRERHRAFIVFGAELPWIYPLAVELAGHGRVTAVRLGATRTLRPPPVRWPYSDLPGTLTREAWTYPAGFAGAFRALFTPIVASRVRALVRRLEAETGSTPVIIAPEPALFRYLQGIAPGQLAYLNYDDYEADVGSGSRSPSQEGEIVARVGTVLCSSAYLTDRFRGRFPGRADDVFHLPHGTHDAFVNPEPRLPPEAGTVCAVGFLSSRYDWALIRAVVTAMPDVRFTFVGDRQAQGSHGQGEEWQRDLEASLALPNVLHVAGRPHRETPPFYWRHAVNWMPYKSDLPFVRACCPLKLSDGLASGRVVVSADVPECRLYPEWVKVHGSAGEAVALLRHALAEDASPSGARAAAQVAFARGHSWRARARELVGILGRGTS